MFSYECWFFTKLYLYNFQHCPTAIIPYTCLYFPFVNSVVICLSSCFEILLKSFFGLLLDLLISTINCISHLKYRFHNYILLLQSLVSHIYILCYHLYLPIHMISYIVGLLGTLVETNNPEQYSTPHTNRILDCWYLYLLTLYQRYTYSRIACIPPYLIS